MAERRMFSKKITESDAFLDLPLSAQCLYFHLSMSADDEGFVNNPKKIQRMIGASNDDMKLLMMKRFIICFDTGIIIIRHWRLHNYIQKDRAKETIYQEEKRMLTTDENKAYILCQDSMDTSCIQNVSIDKYSIDKSSIDKSSIDKPSAPHDSAESPCAGKFLLNDGTEYVVSENDLETYQELYPAIDVRQELRTLTAWCLSNPKNRKTRSGAKRFMNGWFARAQNSAPRRGEKNNTANVGKNKFNNFPQRAYDYEALEAELLNLPSSRDE